MPSSRRAFLKTFLSGTGCFAAAAAFPFAPSEPARPNGDADVHFPQGVASGDPTPDSILLWTRVQRADAPTEHPLPLVVQVSRRHDFSTVLAERALTVTAASDHTARVFVHDLPSDSVLFYRFLAGDGAAASRRGRTRTAPSPDADRPVRFAYASCQAYEAGYYGVYRTLISEDKEAPPEEKLDFVLHLGDFIYEGLGYGDARSVPPFPSGGQHGEGTPHAKTANDYRHLYRTYLSDPHLQAARARWPFLHVWDDHEFTNDAWQSAATYDSGADSAQSRKVAANRAWFEYIPARLSDHEGDEGGTSHAQDFPPCRGDGRPARCQ
ncbi:alkaline phosphatase D family protein [Salinibacter ruber]|uniref:alkaline phosphatase D family protein n=1 Tax=Salinibacter ruber TaxID=146919 RepID=UPI000E57E098|nr:alkaline phosphatase D family protein [Salinibacter ruber]